MPIQTPREYKFIGNSRYLIKKYGEGAVMLLGGHIDELLPKWRENAAISPPVDRYILRELYDGLPNNGKVYFTAKINGEVVGELVNAVEIEIPIEAEEAVEEESIEEIEENEVKTENGSIN